MKIKKNPNGFDLILKKTLSHEGGYVNHPNDKGGATNYGITQDTLSSYLKRSATIEDVKNIDLAIVEAIYMKNFYIANNVQNLDYTIQTQVFDMCVNHGGRNAIKLLQKTVNLLCSTGDRLIADGINGKNTQKIVNQIAKKDAVKLNNILSRRRLEFYDNIIAAKPSQKVFKNGWYARAKDFEISYA